MMLAAAVHPAGGGDLAWDCKPCNANKPCLPCPPDPPPPPASDQVGNQEAIQDTYGKHRSEMTRLRSERDTMLGSLATIKDTVSHLESALGQLESKAQAWRGLSCLLSWCDCWHPWHDNDVWPKPGKVGGRSTVGVSMRGANRPLSVCQQGGLLSSAAQATQSAGTAPLPLYLWTGVQLAVQLQASAEGWLPCMCACLLTARVLVQSCVPCSV
jgi:hypothetical protein